MTKNLALGFIKPHASKSVSSWNWIQTTLNQRGIRLSSETDVTGPQIRKQGLIDRHYNVIATIGGCQNPMDLALNDNTLLAFQNAFGLSWTQAHTQGLLFSGMAALKKMTLTPDALMGLWAATKTAKIGPGFYAATIQGIYVLNGFYPSIREIYTTDDVVIHCFLMEFDGDVLPWKTFRADVIGATDPAKAAPNSIRGALFQRRQELGLSMNARDNVIHASASPFEAMMERSVWMPSFATTDDPLWTALHGSGITLPALTNLANQNPTITLDGKTASAIDQLEDTDTPKTAALIRRMIQ